VRGVLKAARCSRQKSNSSPTSTPGAGRRAHEGGHGLPPPLVGQADDGHVGHRRVAEQECLDLPGVDVFAAPDDHVLHPAGDAAVAPLVHRPEVAGAEPAVG
jgi:hypothetical protein